MKQVITEPTHILESSASCIDLILTICYGLLSTFIATSEMPQSYNIFKTQFKNWVSSTKIAVNFGITVDLIALFKLLIGIIYS